MPELLTIPQLPTPQAAAARGADEAQTTQQGAVTPANTLEPGSSFAAVLKSKSAAQAEESTEDGSRPAELAELPLVPFGAALVSVPVENPSAVRLLAQLTDDSQDSRPAIPVDIAEAPIAKPDIAADLGADPARHAPALAAATEPPRAAGDSTSVPLPSVAVIPASPSGIALTPASLSGVAVSPAPTLGASPAPAMDLSAPSRIPSTEKASGSAAMPPTRGAPLAAMTANSAEPGNPSAATLTAEVGTGILPADPDSGFRPVFEQMTDHPGSASAQLATVSQGVSQNQPGTAPLVRLATPFAQPGWTQEVDQTLNWMVTTARQQADLVLNPPELGRIEVTLVVKGDEVNASFASPHQAVREAIEESLVRLRESLAEAGISLGQTHVGRDSSRDAPFVRPEDDRRQAKGLRHESGTVLAKASAWAPSPGRGMVDVFA